MGNIYMGSSFMSNYRKGCFNLRKGVGKAGTLKEPCEGQAQALSLALGFLGCHLFGFLFGNEGGSYSSVWS